MSKNFFGLLKNQVFPGTEVLDGEDTERERGGGGGGFSKKGESLDDWWTNKNNQTTKKKKFYFELPHLLKKPFYKKRGVFWGEGERGGGGE